MRKSLMAAALSLTAIIMPSIVPSRSEAATTIKVSLWDHGTNMEMPTGLGIGIISGYMTKATMGITETPHTAKAGAVTFEVTNDSKDTIHEMLVIPIADETTQLPYMADQNRVDVEVVHDLGRVAELHPGTSGSLTLNLKAGKYALICNIARHFMAGSWTIITVTP